MSAVAQLGGMVAESISDADSEMPNTLAAPGPSDPLQLLRDFIAAMNSSGGGIPDPDQAADLLSEARRALEHASTVARTLTECQEFLDQDQFDKAFQMLETGLQAYPDDPALVKRRCEVEERHVQATLKETQWLLDSDRPDLAAALVKERLAELPHHPALISRLQIVEPMIPGWEKNRNVRNALERTDALEQLQQWQWALTILEEALQTYPDCQELIVAAKRVRERFDEREREKRLARRLKLLRQRIASQAWRPALAFIEDTLKEFPSAPELETARREVDAGMRRSEREAVVTEVRRCMADGELGLACQSLSQGMESLGKEPALEALRKELDAEVKYREELRTAQVLLGRRQLYEAESVLEGLTMQNRPEAQGLLDAVKKAKTVDGEANFCERGRKKARKLLEEQQYTQAADLLSNLRALFPDNPILEREYLAAQDALSKHVPKIATPLDKEFGNSKPSPLSAPLLPRLPVPAVGCQPNGWTVRIRSSVLQNLFARRNGLLRSRTGHEKRWPILRGFVALRALVAGTAAPVISVQSLPAGPDAARDRNYQDAQLVERTAPEYPALARKRGILGDVQVQATVDEKGTVTTVKVLGGDAILAAAAGNAVLTWKYKPATLNSRPIATTLAVQVSFQDRKK